MNYIPRNYSNAAYFYAQGLGGPLGAYQKSMQSQTILTIDYTGVLGMPNPPNVGGNVGVTGISFVLGTQSLPPLVISKPALAGSQNILSFMVTGGFGGVQYDLSINAKLSNGSVRVDVLMINITAPYEDCGCSSCGHSPCQCEAAWPSGEEQVATLVTNESIFGTNFPQYYVNPKAPQNPNLLDRWYNSTTGDIYDYISDGVKSYWQIESAGIADAPADGHVYGRENNVWVTLDTGGVPEAPVDNKLYGRSNATWVVIPPGGTIGGGLINGDLVIAGNLTVTGTTDLTLDMGIYA